MGELPFDVLVVGGGPGGSVAATVLARAGARVALLDKATFPRDKACGDLVGPRGVQVLADLDISLPAGPVVGNMRVLGPGCRRVRLPSSEGITYPGHGRVIPRAQLDALLHDEAQRCGATSFTGRAEEPLFDNGALIGFRTSAGDVLRARTVIGADGATSRVAAVSGLVDPDRVLWGFAVRTYLPQSVDLPTIVMWDLDRWRSLPGYGWIFPGEIGTANVGLGVGTLSKRTGAAVAPKLLPDFMKHLRSAGMIDNRCHSDAGRILGGWLKMGMVGTTPAVGNVLLVGDAAGLVNPLQGEGIAQAMTSGRAAAEAVIRSPGQAANAYTDVLAGDHLPYQRVTAALQSVLLERPMLVAALGRLLTAPGFGRAMSGGWAVFWNELLDGAPPGRARRVASVATAIGDLATRHTDTARWFDRAYYRRGREPETPYLGPDLEAAWAGIDRSVRRGVRG
jgi:geranylgeranyl reductase family protein